MGLPGWVGVSRVNYVVQGSGDKKWTSLVHLSMSLYRDGDNSVDKWTRVSKCSSPLLILIIDSWTSLVQLSTKLSTLLYRDGLGIKQGLGQVDNSVDNWTRLVQLLLGMEWGYWEGDNEMDKTCPLVQTAL